MPIRGYLSPQNVELAYALASPLARSVLLSLPNPLTGRSWRPCPPQHLAYECILTLRGAPIAITLSTRSKHLKASNCSQTSCVPKVEAFNASGLGVLIWDEFIKFIKLANSSSNSGSNSGSNKLFVESH